MKKEENKNSGWFVTCNICQLSIDTETEFAELIHYHKHKDVKSSAFYHIDCFRKKFILTDKANSELNKAGQILNKLLEKIEGEKH